MSLKRVMHQKTANQAELPLRGKGEALITQRSGETPTAMKGNESSGTDHLMEKVVARANLDRALKRVRQNRGGPGIDGMRVNELTSWLNVNRETLVKELLTGTYAPKSVKRQEIPKSGGGVRELGIPTVVDRLIQQAILQVLQPIFDPTFSSSSYGFRPGRSAHDAIKAARTYIQEGRQWVVDVDLEKFFDRVNHDILMGRLAKRILDKRLLRLIRRYLESGMMSEGVVMERTSGTPQGSPLSPLLANFLLDEVDKELEKRGHAFVRYADDCNVYVRSKRAAEGVMELLKKLFSALKLQVNESKSTIGRPHERKFLGYSFWYGKGGEIKLRVAPKTIQTLKDRIRGITNRSQGRSIEKVVETLRGYLPGWKLYFSMASTPGIFKALDQWIRHRLRMLQFKQWKRGKTAYRELRRRSVSPVEAAKIAFYTRRWWKISGMHLTNFALPPSYYDQIGLPRLAT